ncbi:hypothetical protein TIFTF001_003597 [Ficus carica]|uniref:Uncharacterized protein n=1 Tax=Ficus carica TaxID=3494 RepID=A0AA87ZFQ6_FICCA|nr:hypothetical protein TIFTF001_003597 [Ficus carica]
MEIVDLTMEIEDPDGDGRDERRERGVADTQSSPWSLTTSLAAECGSRGADSSKSLEIARDGRGFLPEVAFARDCRGGASCRRSQGGGGPSHFSPEVAGKGASCRRLRARGASCWR